MRFKTLALFLSFSCLSSFSYGQEREASSVTSMGKADKKWNFTLFSFAHVANMSYGKSSSSERSVESYNYIGLNYKLDTETKVSARLAFNYNTAGQDEHGDTVTSAMSLNDFHLAYSDKDWGYIGDIDISGNVKAYFPTSEASQNSKTITKIRAEVYFEYAVSRFSSVSYVLKPDIYWQHQTAYMKSDIPQYDDGFKKDPRATTKQYSLEHYLEGYVDINKYAALKPKVGFDEDWYYSSDVENLEGSHVTKVKGGLSVEIKPMNGLNFSLGFENSTTLGSYKGKDVTYWQPENTQYTLMTNAFLF